MKKHTLNRGDRIGRFDSLCVKGVEFDFVSTILLLYFKTTVLFFVCLLITYTL